MNPTAFSPSLLESPWFPVGDNRVRLLEDGVHAFSAMLESIARAQREVLLEMYWVGADKVGELFRSALTERAAAGVKVRVVYDALGSLSLNPAWWDSLLQAGGQVCAYHAFWPLEPGFRLTQIQYRNHRKTLVVDGQEGFTGGVNLALPWLPLEQGGQGWKDSVIHVQGSAAQELRTVFYTMWRRKTGGSLPSDLEPLPRAHHGLVWVLTSQRKNRRRSVHREYLFRIRRAQQSIDLASSYFVPNWTVRSALFHAVQRGVRVRLLVPLACDVLPVQFAVESLIETLLRHGVELYALPPPFLHAKTAIVDTDFVTIGSCNLDRLSWRKNLELNLAVEDKAFAQHVRSSFERDVAKAVRLELHVWRKRSPLRRVAEWLAWSFRDLL